RLSRSRGNPVKQNPARDTWPNGRSIYRAGFSLTDVLGRCPIRLSLSAMGLGGPERHCRPVTHAAGPASSRSLGRVGVLFCIESTRRIALLTSHPFFGGGP